MSINKYFYIYTLGCKINQYESQAIREAWLGAEYQECTDPEQADIIVMNSCAVTAHAVRDLRQQTRRLMRLAPEAKVIITGCAAEVLHKELAKDFGDALIVPQSKKEELLTLPMATPDASISTPEQSPAALHFPKFSITGYNRVRAVVKVQDGCTHRCTYCIIPSTRGKSVSRPMQDTAEEIHRIFEAGWHEVTLSGINLRQFGRDLDGSPNFWDLMEYLEKDLAPTWAGKARLRISSLDPGQLTEQALTVLGTSRMVCPQLHISLQSLAPAVLRRMGRGHYSFESVSDWLKGLAAYWPFFGLGTDLIAGFPGETDEDFQETLAHMKELPLTYAHVFPYSQRPGTPAARYPEQVPTQIKKERAALLRKCADEKKQAFLEHLAQQPELDVVLEKLDPARGVCQHYADCVFPDTLEHAEKRQMVRAVPIRREGNTLLVRPA
ncbi:tRNA (N(6)-L-threonylcarbamoyladenosine(37)-C(2))-methylthiotransferase MtaB [Desulfobaculum bizertense]|uniref:MiaB-like tRNA modifying enzyme n=1 Tax=Desulfobaculum bizertense DSM 18034 TaxID=1121442 RepID=A0A1T4WHZ0_9BACT|nr:tRNA (N(6)-L-threonylcarbamoyladenosine(37)-C(2))-methylthiotransferase MtaB [Desulfobaculum bizertense]SKA76271.1 MiaB-like tRNA modifying enzyme [Desulfobaculum bizertense DSM 18034]